MRSLFGVDYLKTNKDARLLAELKEELANSAAEHEVPLLIAVRGVFRATHNFPASCAHG